MCVCVCVCVSGIWTIVLSFPVSFFEVFCVYLWEKAMAPHSSTLAWKIPWMEEPGGLQSMGSLRVRHDWATSLSLLTFMHWRRQWQPTPVFLPGESHRGEPDGLPSMGLHRVRHGWSDLAAAVIHRASEPGQSSNDEVHANIHAACDPLRLESPTQLCFPKS